MGGQAVLQTTAPTNERILGTLEETCKNNKLLQNLGPLPAAHTRSGRLFMIF